jgi:hypothetical protein
MVLVGFATYMVVRALARSDRAEALQHGRDILHVESLVGIDWERGAQLLALRHEVVMSTFNAVYAWAYWPMLIGALVFLWRRHPERYVVFRNALFLSGAMGLVVFTTFPVAPPRMLDGFTDTVSDASRQHFLVRPSGFINPYAALPSFHAGWTILAALVVAGTLTGVWRHVVLATLPWMPVAVVVTANHYVVDVLLGVALSLVALAVAARLAGGLRPAPARARAAPASAAGPHGHPHAVAAPDGKG